MPCTDGGTPVTMQTLFTLVNVGIAPRARPRKPLTLMRCRFGIRPRMMAASRYSSAEPSRQLTITGRVGGWEARPLTLKDWVLITPMGFDAFAPLPLRRCNPP